MERLAPKLVGVRVKRVEDPRYLAGKGTYVDDLRLPGTLHVAFLRSPLAHARIERIDPSPALQEPGVVSVLTGQDLVGLAHPLRTELALPGYRACSHPHLAVEKVRFSGDPLVVVVAQDAYRAEDALELVEVEYDPLEVVPDAEAGMSPGAPVLHEELGDNLLFRSEFKAGDIEGAFREADLILRERFKHHRCTGAPIEPRGCVAQYDPVSGTLTLWSSTQIPHLLRTTLADCLSFPEHRLRVIAPDVGGGFGIKSHVFPEEMVVCLLALQLAPAPVKWMEDRREHLTSSIHAREEIHQIEVAARRDGTLLGIRDRIIGDVGAYSAFPWSGAGEVLFCGLLLPGPYKLQNYACELSAVLTNKCPLSVYRGVSQPVSTLVIESMMDRLARELSLDPAEVRLRNMVQASEFPYQTVTGMVYESGSYVESLRKALEMIDYEQERQEQTRSRQEGKYRGIGISCYVEATAVGSAAMGAMGLTGISGYDVATVRMDPGGKVTVLAGVSSHGQGHQTVLAQVAAEELGLALEDVTVVQGDTAVAPYGMGTWGSRSAVAGGGAVKLAAHQVREKVCRIAAPLMDAAPEELEVGGGEIYLRQAPERSLPLKEIARLAHLTPHRLPEGEEAGLEATQHYDPPPVTFANSAHVALVEVDDRTGQVSLLRYAVVEDCGNMINPMIVEGQVHGGVSHGIGNVLYEELVYDENGQLLNSTFMDYLVPTALEIPNIEVEHLVTPSPLTVGGFKGMGEGGAIAPPAALLNGIVDALAPLGVTLSETPLTPERIWKAIQEARAAAGRP